MNTDEAVIERDDNAETVSAPLYESIKAVGVTVTLADTETIDDIVPPPPLSPAVCEGERVS